MIYDHLCLHGKTGQDRTGHLAWDAKKYLWPQDMELRHYSAPHVGPQPKYPVRSCPGGRDRTGQDGTSSPRWRFSTRKYFRHTARCSAPTGHRTKSSRQVPHTRHVRMCELLLTGRQRFATEQLNRGSKKNHGPTWQEPPPQPCWHSAGHTPLTWSHVSPAAHLQVFMQLSPKVPPAQAAKEKCFSKHILKSSIGIFCVYQRMLHRRLAVRCTILDAAVCVKGDRTLLLWRVWPWKGPRMSDFDCGGLGFTKITQLFEAFGWGRTFLWGESLYFSWHFAWATWLCSRENSRFSFHSSPMQPPIRPIQSPAYNYWF